MRRNFIFVVIWAVLTSMALSQVSADDFKLTNSELIKGRVAGPNEDGLVIALDIGGYSPRIPWAKFSQETLKNLTKDPRTRAFAEPFIEIPLEVKAKRAAQERQKNKFTLRYEPKIARPEGPNSIFAGISSPLGLGILGLLYLANLVAAWEIARFKDRSAGLVCGLSALLPIAGPLVILAMPTATPKTSDTETSALDAAAAASAPTTPAAASGGGGLTMSKPKSSATAVLQPAKYARGEFTFNRRFFETKFPGFFRVVLGDAEKEFVLVFKTDRDEHVVRRIPRITANDIYILLVKGNEVGLSFDEIREVQLRPKQSNE